MKVFKLSFVVFCMPLFFGCDESPTDEKIELGVNKQSEVMETCNCDSLLSEGDLLKTKSNKVFTGTCYLNYPNSDQRYIEKQILEGKIHGNVTYYDKNDNVLLEEVYVDGQQDKNESFCNCADLVKKESGGEQKFFLNNKPFTGTCEDYFPNSDQVYLQATYKSGNLDGFVNYFSKNGEVIMMQKYENGEFLKDILPSK